MILADASLSTPPGTPYEMILQIAVSVSLLADHVSLRLDGIRRVREDPFVRGVLFGMYFKLRFACPCNDCMLQLDILLVQFPDMFFNHFLECVFYFNGVVHASWTVARQGTVAIAIPPMKIRRNCMMRG